MSSDLTPPKLFTVITSSKVQYNMDTVEYLISQEEIRRSAGNLPRLSETEKAEFRRQLISTLIIQGDADKAINLRPLTIRKQLNG